MSLQIDKVVDGNLVFHTHPATDITPITGTKAAILARTGDSAGQIYYATDTYEFLINDGSDTYRKVPFILTTQSPNSDIGYEQNSNDLGYGDDYVTNKLLASIDIGNASDTSNASSTRIPIRASGGFLQAYINSTWQNIVIGFTFAEIAGYGYALTHLPAGLSNQLEVMSGNSITNLGLNGLPITQGYITDIGAYPSYPIAGGITI